MRDAANSIANGIPSSWRQISTTASSANEMAGATLEARSMNNVAALESTSSEGTGQSCSSETRKPSRLVASILTVAEWARIASIMSAAASSKCSQLSNTRSRDRPSKAEAMLSARLMPGCWVIPRTAANRVGHRTRIADCGQFDDEHAIGEVIRRASGDLECQPCLAHPADACQRHHPMRLQCRL